MTLVFLFLFFCITINASLPGIRHLGVYLLGLDPHIAASHIAGRLLRDGVQVVD